MFRFRKTADPSFYWYKILPELITSLYAHLAIKHPDEPTKASVVLGTALTRTALPQESLASPFGRVSAAP